MNQESSICSINSKEDIIKEGDSSDENINKIFEPTFVKYSGKNPRGWYAAGVIIFNYDLTKTIIVKTPKKNTGFPKGAREPYERVHQTAYREVQEETGLHSFQYKHDKTLIGEKKGSSEKTKCSIYYFMGVINTKEIEMVPLKCFNNFELSFVGWVTIEKAYTMLCKKRQNILRSAYQYISEQKNKTKSIEIH